MQFTVHGFRLPVEKHKGYTFPRAKPSIKNTKKSKRQEEEERGQANYVNKTGFFEVNSVGTKEKEGMIRFANGMNSLRNQDDKRDGFAG